MPTDLPQIAGAALSVGRAGYKYRDRDDLLLMHFAEGTTAAGVLTRSRCPSPEVDWCRRVLDSGRPARALLVSSGNSNAFTGSAGAAATSALLTALSSELSAEREQIFIAATGVIGEPLPAEKGIAALSQLAAAQGDWSAAARAIGTTDTFPKLATATAVVGGRTVRVNGIAKGSGMIAPDMATMLAFLATDAAVERDFLQHMMTEATRLSFNAITVDSDTSTSDTALLFATGQSGAPGVSGWDSPGADALFAAIVEVCTALAKLIVVDGEGASKLITVRVTGAESDESARRVALSIANSPLVKTAIAGEDANWGRVVMAVGKAGEPAERDRLSISFGGVEIAKNGARVDQYDEKPVAAHLKGDEVDLCADLGIGSGQARVWTCDLTHGYISINADYRS